MADLTERFAGRLGSVVLKTTILRAEIMKQLTGAGVETPQKPQPADFVKTPSLPYQDLIRQHLDELEAEADKFVVSEFKEGQTWFNTSGPISLRNHLSQKLVIMDFWTYCCANCLHALPDLLYLESKWPVESGLAIVGVHSAKFENEREDSNVLQAVQRYHIKHAVVNDSELRHWNELNVQSWPTLVVLGPRNNLLLILAGEGHLVPLEQFIGEALQYYKEKGMISSTSLPLQLESDKKPFTSPIKFPGKVASLASQDRLFISDTGHHRIVVTTLDGKPIFVIGTGSKGFQDGKFASASFNSPNGLAVAVNPLRLFVCDTENHAIRLIDFDSQTVSTIAGTGKQGSDYNGGLTGKEQALSTPWDIVYRPGDEKSAEKLYIAMAGIHQIWEIHLGSGVAVRIAGSGVEANRHSSDPKITAFAQPSGLSFGSSYDDLFIADSESSSIRAIGLNKFYSRSVAGGSKADPSNLFVFGDVDGKGDAARLQHPIGVVYVPEAVWTGVPAQSNSSDGGALLVADTFNHKIKVIRPIDKGDCRAYTGTGKVGFNDGESDEALFYEPSGLALDEIGRRVYVADTNNHAIRVVHLEEFGQVSTLNLSGVPPPSTTTTTRSASPTTTSVQKKRLVGDQSNRVRSHAVSVAQNGSGVIKLVVSTGPLSHFTPEAPSRYQIFQPEPPLLQFKQHAGQLIDWQTLTDMEGVHHAEVELAFSTSQAQEGLVDIELALYSCSDEDGCCVSNGVIIELPVVFNIDAPLQTATQVHFELEKGLINV